MEKEIDRESVRERDRNSGRWGNDDKEDRAPRTVVEYVSGKAVGLR
jgi:hypothetical protein